MVDVQATFETLAAEFTAFGRSVTATACQQEKKYNIYI